MANKALKENDAANVVLQRGVRLLRARCTAAADTTPEPYTRKRRNSA